MRSRDSLLDFAAERAVSAVELEPRTPKADLLRVDSGGDP